MTSDELAVVRRNLSCLNPRMRASQSECACSTCQAMCTKPCWPTPREAERLEAKYPGSLVVDENVTYNDIPIKAKRPKTVDGYCTFYRNGRCLIHKTKPLEGRLASHAYSSQELTHLRMAVALMWR